MEVLRPALSALTASAADGTTDLDDLTAAVRAHRELGLEDGLRIVSEAGDPAAPARRDLSSTIEQVGSMATLTERFERRGAERVPVIGVVEVEQSGRSLTLDLVDVSLTGLRCTVLQPVGLRVGESVAVRVETGGHVLRATASVVRNEGDEAGHDLGLTFTRLDETARAVLRELVRSRR